MLVTHFVANQNVVKVVDYSLQHCAEESIKPFTKVILNSSYTMLKF
jgi:hypothetical protein